MSTAKIKFGELPSAAPTTSRRPGKHGEIAMQLRERPGEWALVSTAKSAYSMNSMAYQIRAAYYAAYLPRGSFEAAGRTVDGERRVYARYIGEGGEYA